MLEIGFQDPAFLLTLPGFDFLGFPNDKRRLG